MKKKRKFKHNRIKFKIEHAITTGMLAYAGCNQNEITKYLDISDTGFTKWKKREPLIQFALKQAKHLRTSLQKANLQDYVVSRLSPQTREVWDSIMFWQDHKDSATKISAISRNLATPMRQRIFLYALIRSKWSVSSACAMTGISRDIVQDWKHDADFKRLLEEVMSMQEDFIETSLMDLIAIGHPGAVIFANSTKNKHRGYGQKLEIDQNINGTLNVEHTFKMERLMDRLSVKARAELVGAMKALDAEDNALKLKSAALAEPVEVETETLDSESDEED